MAHGKIVSVTAHKDLECSVRDLTVGDLRQFVEGLNDDTKVDVKYFAGRSPDPDTLKMQADIQIAGMSKS